MLDEDFALALGRRDLEHANLCGAAKPTNVNAHDIIGVLIVAAIWFILGKLDDTMLAELLDVEERAFDRTSPL